MSCPNCCRPLRSIYVKTYKTGHSLKSKHDYYHKISNKSYCIYCDLVFDKVGNHVKEG